MTFNAATALFRGIACTLALVVAVALQGCTGGTVILAEGGIVGTGATALSVSGTIASFGADSITVNGRTLSTTKAVVRIDDAPGSVADLRVGMVVDIAATVDASGAATAGTIVYRAAARGVADGLDRNARTFTLLGQTVQTDGNTVFDGGTIDSDTASNVPIDGMTLPSTPEYLFNASVERRFDFDSVDVFLRGDYSLRGSSFGDVPNTPPPGGDLTSGTSRSLDLRAGVRFANWELQAFATNVTNELDSTFTFYDGGFGDLSVLLRPRTIGLNLKVHTD